MDNYEILETIHKSKTVETIVFKAKEKNKKTCDKVYALKLIGELNNRFQKLMFKREVDALKTLNSCNGIVKIRDYVLNAEFDGKNDCGLILLDYDDGTNLEEVELNPFSQIEKYELCQNSDKSIFLRKKTNGKSVDSVGKILYIKQVSDYWTGCRGTVGSAPHW